jgi:hypothetical protein
MRLLSMKIRWNRIGYSRNIQAAHVDLVVYLDSLASSLFALSYDVLSYRHHAGE